VSNFLISLAATRFVERSPCRIVEASPTPVSTHVSCGHGKASAIIEVKASLGESDG
jgi:hypothetical protein